MATIGQDLKIKRPLCCHLMENKAKRGLVLEYFATIGEICGNIGVKFIEISPIIAQIYWGHSLVTHFLCVLLVIKDPNLTCAHVLRAQGIVEKNLIFFCILNDTKSGKMMATLMLLKHWKSTH